MDYLRFGQAKAGFIPATVSTVMSHNQGCIDYGPVFIHDALVDSQDPPWSTRPRASILYTTSVGEGMPAMLWAHLIP